jgi:hypothetical protein
MILALFLLCLIVGCGREACYASNDADFDEALELCEKEGLTYDECPDVARAEAEQERKDKLCP